MRDYQEIRKEAELWAKEYDIRRRNRRVLKVVAVVAIIIGIVLVSRATVILLTRAHFESADAMKEAMQGRYMYGEYEELVIDGDKIYFTYYNVNEDRLDEAEFNEYTGSYLDSTYEMKILKWNGLTGEIITDWGSTIIINTDKNPVYYGSVYEKTDEERKIPRRNKEEAMEHDEKEAEADKHLNEAEQEQKEDAEKNMKELENELENSASDA